MLPNFQRKEFENFASLIIMHVVERNIKVFIVINQKHHVELLSLVGFIDRGSKIKY